MTRTEAIERGTAKHGSLAAYWAYMRPRTFPLTFVFVLTGYVLAPGAASIWDLLFLFLVYSVFGWGGANAFNSAEDRDDGPVNLLPNPPPRPRHLRQFGIGCGVLAVLLASAWPAMQRTLVPIAIAGALSFAYSWKSSRVRRLKEVGLADNVTNACGCGPLALAIGWGARAPYDASLAGPSVGFFLALFGGYTTTQIFQLAPDEPYTSARNYTTWVGPKRALRIGALAFVLHVAVLAFSLRWTSPASAAFGVWATLVALAAVHSYAWASTPFVNPHGRMLRQMGLMMASQLAFVAGHLLS